VRVDARLMLAEAAEYPVDMREVHGQKAAKRALSSVKLVKVLKNLHCASSWALVLRPYSMLRLPLVPNQNAACIVFKSCEHSVTAGSWLIGCRSN
jgi:hypothetical protein